MLTHNADGGIPLHLLIDGLTQRLPHHNLLLLGAGNHLRCTAHCGHEGAVKATPIAIGVACVMDMLHILTNARAQHGASGRLGHIKTLLDLHAACLHPKGPDRVL